MESQKFLTAFFILGCSMTNFCGKVSAEPTSTERIQPYKVNPRYWQYKGKPVLLLGGSVEDNLFQIPELVSHLDLLKSVGGNYVRNTMSSRDPGNVWPFKKVGEKYDLNQWNDEYWRRFENFLAETAQRDIIVQIEIWATFDYYRDNWHDQNPFNPRNNINYTAKESGLPVVVNSHPIQTRNNFFRSVPNAENLPIVLQYQQKFVEKILSYSLNYGHVLYCMDNETSVTPKWGAYWATFIKEKAAQLGRKVETTEMWDKWDLSDPMHNATFDHPELYSFIDISQNNHQKGQTHYDNGLKQRRRIQTHPRPLTNVKIYGADTGHFGNSRDGVERFWRNIFGGHASARFHRPTAGLGLSELAQRMIKSAREVTNAFNIFSCEPHNDLLARREDNEAYCIASPGREYAIYFTRAGEVTLDTKDAQRQLSLHWYDINNGKWMPVTKADGGGTISLKTPGTGQWVVVIT